MTEQDVRKALLAKKGKLDIISMVTCISVARLKEIARGSEMTRYESITLRVNA